MVSRHPLRAILPSPKTQTLDAFELERHRQINALLVRHAVDEAAREIVPARIADLRNFFVELEGCGHG